MRIRIGEDELPLREDIEKLTIAEWMRWLQARLSTSDAYTGQVLYGTAFPLRIIRDSITRLDVGEASQRCVEASLQRVRDRVLRLRRGNYCDEDERREEIHELRELLTLLKELPSFIVKQCVTLAERADDLYDCVIRPPGFNIIDTPGDAALVRNTIQFLKRYAPGRLRVNELESFLQYTPCSQTTLHALQELEPARSAHWLREYFRFCRSNDQLLMFTLEAERIKRKLGEEQGSQILEAVVSGLEVDEQPDFLGAVSNQA